MSDWLRLRRFTQARIGLTRAGAALSTPELLALQLAHAQARDAVWRAWDAEACATALAAEGIESLLLRSAAHDRTSYLKRPDLGRQLDPDSTLQLRAAASDPAPDVALVLSDGLSATAVDAHGVNTLRCIRRALERTQTRCSPVVLVQQGRVAISDAIGAGLGARVAVIVLGERPGLSAVDSLGIYLTHAPKPGNSDAQRNCISNVREPAGLPPAAAAERLVALLHRSLALGMSGVALKDESPALT